MAVPAAKRLGRSLEVFGVALDGLHRLAPVRRAVALEPEVVVVGEQRLDVGHVAGDRRVVGLAPEADEGAGDDVGEAPGELAKGGGVPRRGELGRDARGHLGDAPELADRVVALRDLRAPAQNRAGRCR